MLHGANSCRHPHDGLVRGVAAKGLHPAAPCFQSVALPVCVTCSFVSTICMPTQSCTPSVNGLLLPCLLFPLGRLFLRLPFRWRCFTRTLLPHTPTTSSPWQYSSPHLQAVHTPVAVRCLRCISYRSTATWAVCISCWRADRLPGAGHYLWLGWWQPACGTCMTGSKCQTCVRMRACRSHVICTCMSMRGHVTIPAHFRPFLIYLPLQRPALCVSVYETIYQVRQKERKTVAECIQSNACANYATAGPAL
jgi:hypothetical protein